MVAQSPEPLICNALRHRRAPELSWGTAKGGSQTFSVEGAAQGGTAPKKRDVLVKTYLRKTDCAFFRSGHGIVNGSSRATVFVSTSYRRSVATGTIRALSGLRMCGAAYLSGRRLFLPSGEATAAASAPEAASRCTRWGSPGGL